MSSVSPGGADLVPTTPDWPAWVEFMVTTHFDLVSGPFHSPNFIGLHSVSTSANMYHLNPRAGELPRSASSHFLSSMDGNGVDNDDNISEKCIVTQDMGNDGMIIMIVMAVVLIMIQFPSFFLTYLALW